MKMILGFLITEYKQKYFYWELFKILSKINSKKNN